MFQKFLDYFPDLYIRQRDFSFIQSVIQRERVLVGKVECGKKALFCDDCCDRNRPIILVVLVLVGL